MTACKKIIIHEINNSLFKKTKFYKKVLKLEEVPFKWKVKDPMGVKRTMYL